MFYICFTIFKDVFYTFSFACKAVSAMLFLYTYARIAIFMFIYLYVLFSVYLCAQPKPTLFIYRSIPLLIYIVKQKSKVIVLIAFL